MSNRVLKSLNGPKFERKNDQPLKNVLTQIRPKSSKQSEKSTLSVLASKENIVHSTTRKQELEGHSSSANPHKVKIFNEENCRKIQKSKRYKSTGTQTDQENSKALVCSEEPTDKYWELLAEQRRQALADVLDENQRLAEELEAKKTELEEIKLEKDRLEEVASDPQYLFSVINEFMQSETLVPANSPRDLSDDDLIVDGSMHNDEEKDAPQRRYKLSEGSCGSHDSDKENKPPVD